MTTHKKYPVSCNVYIADEEVQFHYPDTSLVLSNDLGNLYAMDRDSQTQDVFGSGDFENILLNHLGTDLYNTFLEDFGHAGFHLCSRTNTHSVLIDDLESA